MEESALRGLEALSVTDSLLGFVVDSLDSDSTGSQLFSRTPSNSDLLQLMLFACKAFLSRWTLLPGAT